jgi:hypothetical protein
MNLKAIAFAIVAMGALVGCGNDGQSVGNGPGNADGVGGRTDPPAATDDGPSKASTTDPVGAQTSPDGSTEDTSQRPLQTNEPPTQTPASPPPQTP